MSTVNNIIGNLKGDRVIWVIFAILTLFSILTVYSATGTIAYKERGGNTEFYLLKHGVIIFMGVFLAYLSYMLHYMRYRKAAAILMLTAIPLLMFTIAFGAEVNQARRWITVPIIDLTFQTSDFAKLALIVWVAKAISSKQDYITDFKSAFLPIIIPILIIVGLIAPADLSSALLLFLTTFLMMFIGRVHWKYLGLLIFLGIVVFAVMIVVGEFFPDFIRVDTWVARLREFMENADGGYQVQQGKIAMANGEWIGLGPGNSTQRNFVPSPYSDFIYSIIIEEYGLIGGFSILGLYVLLFFRTVRLVTKSPRAFGAILAVGLSLNIVIQAFANMAVSVNLVPVTGLTLPMVSMGGTSLLFTSISFGIILSVSKYIESISEPEKEIA